MNNLSVIIPVYNAGKTLPRLINCIKKQKDTNSLEFIFVNDGSTDDSLQILNQLKQKNVKVIVQKNSGVSSARNNGIRNASYDYITFLDADDYIDDDYYETLRKEINTHKCDLIISGYSAEYSDGTTITKRNREEAVLGTSSILKKYFTGAMDPNCWNKVFKKDLLNKALFDEKMTLGEDKDMLFRYLCKSKKVFFDNNAKYHYSINKESAMRRNFKPELFKTIQKADFRTDYIRKHYPELFEYAYSSEIDTKCRVLCGIYSFNQCKKYKNERRALKSDIAKCGILRKKRYSSKKHFLAFMAVRISPRLYVFLKEKMKLQYQ